MGCDGDARERHGFSTCLEGLKSQFVADAGVTVLFARLQQAIDEETEAAPGPCSPDSVLLYTYTGGTTKHSKCVVVTCL